MMMASKLLIGAGVAGVIIIGAFALQYSLGSEAREEKALVAKSQELSEFLERAHDQPSLDQACQDLEKADARLREIAVNAHESFILSPALRYCPQPSEIAPTRQ
jgi:hypothetical protein